MSQGADGIDLPTSLGYLLKEAASALRAAMEEALRPLGMTITHYSCLGSSPSAPDPRTPTSPAAPS